MGNGNTCEFDQKSFFLGRHVLCIVPISTVQNWLAEFNRWLPAPSRKCTNFDQEMQNFEQNLGKNSSWEEGAQFVEEDNFVPQKGTKIKPQNGENYHLLFLPVL